MNHLHRSALAFAALLVASSARAQDVSTEVGATTIWFALLVVVFALLVSVGLFIADDANTSDATAEPEQPPAPSPVPRRRVAHSRRKQQEFS